MVRLHSAPTPPPPPPPPVVITSPSACDLDGLSDKLVMRRNLSVVDTADGGAATVDGADLHCQHSLPPLPLPPPSAAAASKPFSQ